MKTIWNLFNKTPRERELLKECEKLRRDLRMATTANNLYSLYNKEQFDEIQELKKALHTVQSTAGKWMSACLSDDKACDEIKVDFNIALEALHTALNIK